MILELMMMSDLLTSIYNQEQQCCQQAKLVASDGGCGGYLVTLYLYPAIMHLLELFSLVLQGQLRSGTTWSQLAKLTYQRRLLRLDNLIEWKF